MAKSYYKFDKRPDKVTVDWGAISKDFSTRLSKERNRREDLKSEIAEDTKKYLRTVQDTPQGQNQSANDRMASFAEAATKTRLMQEQKLKSGELKLRDYYAQKANLEQGTTDLFEVAKNFNTNFEKNMQRANTNASQVEIWNNGRMQDFANPAQSQIIVDPETGEVLVAKIVDGVPSKTDIASVFSLKSGVNQEIDRVDVKDWANKTLETYKEDFQQVLASGGSVTSKLNNPKFKKAIDKDVAAKLKTGSYTAASVLADNTDKEYTFSTDEKDRGKDGVIMMIPNPKNPSSGVLIPDLTEAQEKEAAKVLKDSILGRLGRKETPAPKVTKSDIEVASIQDRTANYKKDITDVIVLGGDDFSESAERLITRYNKDSKKGEDIILSIDKAEDSILIEYENKDGGTRLETIDITGKSSQQLAADLSPLSQDIFLLDDGNSISVIDAFEQAQANESQVMKLTDQITSRNFPDATISVQKVPKTNDVRIKIDDLIIEVAFSEDDSRAYVNSLQTIFDRIRKGDVEGIQEDYKTIKTGGMTNAERRAKRLKEQKEKREGKSEEPDYSNL
jgi:cytochrome c556